MSFFASSQCLGWECTLLVSSIGLYHP
uniref:Uncharacterized protein n=1 Tax=Arundo donax TaxID=35708 RepID=A0A0A9BHC3_ARUDO